MRARSPVRADAAIVAFITQRTVIERSLAHLAQRAARASSRPEARGPPSTTQPSRSARTRRAIEPA